MNLLFLTIGELSDLNEKSMYPELIRYFRDKGHHVHVVCQREQRYGLPTQKRMEYGIKVLRVKTGNITKTNWMEKGISTLKIGRQYKNAIKKFFKKVRFDVILYSTPPITLVSTVQFIKKRDHAFTYLLLKDIFPHNALDIGILKRTGWKGILTKRFLKKEKKLYLLSDQIGCMSEANVQYLKEKYPYLDSGKIEVCPNTQNENSFCLSDRLSARDKFHLPQDKLVFVCGGNFGRPQDVDFILQILKNNEGKSDRHFVFSGSGTDYHKLREYAEKQNESHVTVLENLKKKEFSKLLDASDVGLIFLDHRFTIPNFPSRILDYMSHSMPILAATDKNTDVGNIITGNGFGWWCESNDADTYQKILDEICENPMVIKEMRINSRAFHISNYDTRIAYEKIMNAYRSGLKAAELSNQDQTQKVDLININPEMKILQINITCQYGSTGRKVEEIHNHLIKEGFRSYVAYAAFDSNLEGSFKIETTFENYLRRVLNRYFGKKFVHSSLGTIRLIRKIRQLRPDLIHLHNIQQNCIDYPRLLKFLKKYEVPVVYTLHDCWGFTGGCYHFTQLGCEGYQTGCMEDDCKLSKEEKDICNMTTHQICEEKKTALNELKQLRIVCVSNWLKSCAEKSFLRDMPLQVIYNGIDTDIFRPVSSNIREEFGISEEDFMILGVANHWNDKKGLDTFFKLSEHLPAACRIVLVGISEESCPENIIIVKRTDVAEELVRIYSSADVYINASKEETFGLTSVEAMACGTPVIAYHSTACDEVLSNDTGIVLYNDRLLDLQIAIENIRKNGKAKYRESCRNHVETKFSKEKMLSNYLHLYTQMLGVSNGTR
ncbi:MAG TPA: glycosyltransferase [Mobilitalea sp.]|nr:glycosyltransferase [Mobilitalea sp.]